MTHLAQRPTESPTSGADARARLAARFSAVRAETERRAAPLSAEDQVVQSMPDASPTKWHRAHVTWFFEQFVLEPHLAGYTAFDPRFSFLFNSYYVTAGPRAERPKRGLVTRPDSAEVTAYRAYVDAAMARLIAEAPAGAFVELARLVEIGLNHEQQHQELLLTDILHAFSENPTAPAYDARWRRPPTTPARGEEAALHPGVYRMGHDAQDPAFAYDNEGPAHQTLIPAQRLAKGLVTNRDWLAFMDAGGYDDPLLWLSDGFAHAQQAGWRAPLYWRELDGAWHAFGLDGLSPLDPDAPVCHVSYYEADAFARFCGKVLPTEAAFEAAAGQDLLHEAFGVVWQWTASAYLPYPGYRPAPGALGEYNGKFMVNQMVLRGSSHATPEGHARLTYRNFFHPHQRWQFTGVRLADDT